MTVTIIDKSGLSVHGGDAKEAALEYRKSITDARRKIDVKIEGQEAAAIQAFVGKLNAISRVLYETYPRALEQYNEAILNYVAAVEGLGFSSNEVKTKEGDIQQIKEWLGTTKAKEFVELGDELNTALKAASEALELSPHPVYFSRDASRFTHGVAMRLSSLGEERETIHTDLVGSMKAFKNSLDSVQTTLAPLGATLKNAQFIKGFSIPTALSLISAGRLTENNMQFLDSVQAEKDGEVLHILLSEGLTGAYRDREFFRKLGSVEGSKISQPMMDIVYTRVYSEFEAAYQGYIQNVQGNEALRNLESFMTALGKQKLVDSKAYTEKLVIASDRVATILAATLLGKIPELPEKGSDKSAYDQYNLTMDGLSGELRNNAQRLAKMGILSSLFESAYLKDIGIAEVNDPAGRLKSHTGFGNLRFTSDGDTVVFKWDLSKQLGGANKSHSSTTVTVLSTGDTTILDLDGHLANLKELSDKRKQAFEGLAKDLLTSVVDKALPGVGSLINLVGATVEMQGERRGSALIQYGQTVEGTVHSFHPFADEFHSTFQKNSGSLVKALSVLEEFHSLDEAEQKERIQLGQDLFNIGGYSVKDGDGNVHVSYKSTYDLQTILQMDDLEKNGLRAHTYRQSGRNLKAVEQFDTYMSQYEPMPKRNLFEQAGNWFNEVTGQTHTTEKPNIYKGHMSGKTKEFLAGKSQKSVLEIGQDKIWQGMSELGEKDYTSSKNANGTVQYPDLKASWYKEYASGSRDYYNHLLKLKDEN